MTKNIKNNGICYRLNENYLKTCTIFGKSKMKNISKSISPSKLPTVSKDDLDMEI